MPTIYDDSGRYWVPPAQISTQVADCLRTASTYPFVIVSVDHLRDRKHERMAVT